MHPLAEIGCRKHCVDVENNHFETDLCTICRKIRKLFVSDFLRFSLYFTINCVTTGAQIMLIMCIFFVLLVANIIYSTFRRHTFQEVGGVHVTQSLIFC